MNDGSRGRGRSFFATTSSSDVFVSTPPCPEACAASSLLIEIPARRAGEAAIALIACSAGRRYQRPSRGRRRARQSFAVCTLAVMKRIGIVVVAYNAAATLSKVLDRIPFDFW